MQKPAPFTLAFYLFIFSVQISCSLDSPGSSGESVDCTPGKKKFQCESLELGSPTMIVISEYV
jgi:hypothetical protein